MSFNRDERNRGPETALVVFPGLSIKVAGHAVEVLNDALLAFPFLFTFSVHRF
jgi:hypothetical protein